MELALKKLLRQKFGPVGGDANVSFFEPEEFDLFPLLAGAKD